MKYPVIVAPFLKVDGMALFPFILIRHEGLRLDPILIRHETIHLKQALELFIVPFYILYLFNYLYNRIKYPSHHQAYMNIVFEREAYAHEQDKDYLNRRKLWAWARVAV